MSGHHSDQTETDSGHGHNHDHSGHSHAPIVNASNRRRVGIAAVLTGLFCIVEVVGELYPAL